MLCGILGFLPLVLDLAGIFLGLALHCLSLDDSGVGRAWLLIVLVPGFGCGVWLLLGCSQASRPGVPGACAGSDCAGTCSFPVVVADGAGQVGSGMACSRCQQLRNASFQGQSGLIFRCS